MTRALVAALALGACTGEVGTLELDLATSSPNLIDRISKLRITLTNPTTVFEVARTARGFDLSLDLEATGKLTSVIVEGLDGDALIASGMSPPFAVAPINGHIVVYLAPPLSLGMAPSQLLPARSATSAAPLTYGAVIPGGTDAAGPVSAIQIYNAYDHELQTGEALPSPRASLTAAVGTGGGVYLFGGVDPQGLPTGTLWRFDSTIAPDGFYTELGDFPELARADAVAIPIATERFLITGQPALELLEGRLTTRDDIDGVVAGASIPAREGATALIQRLDGTLLRFRDNAFEPLAIQRPGATVVALPGGRFGLFGGPDADVVVVDAASGEPAIASRIAQPTQLPLVAVTPRFVVVTPSTAADKVEIFASDTLAPVASIPNTERFRSAIALPNEQVLLIGATLQLFTPPPP